MGWLSFLWPKSDIDAIVAEAREGNLRVARAAYERGKDDGYAQAVTQLAAVGENYGADYLMTIVRSRAADAARIE